MQKKELYAVPVPVLDTYALTVCALLTALSVVLARLLTVIPSEVSRFSSEPRSRSTCCAFCWNS